MNKIVWVKFALLGVLVSWSLAAVAAVPTVEDKVVELKFSNWIPVKRALHREAVAWGESVERESNGSIKVTMYAEAKLGKPIAHYDMVKNGTADVGYIVMGYYQPKQMQVSGAVLLPFLVDNADNGSRAFDEWYRPYAAKDIPGVKTCITFVHDPGTLHSKVRISSPEQLRGMKVRAATAVVADWLKYLGATSVEVPAPDVSKAISSGAADALTFPFGLVYSYQVDKATSFHIDAPMYTSVQAWIINQAKYNSMSAAQKKVIDNHCNSDWAYRVGKAWGDEERAGYKRMKADPTHTVVRLSPVELAQWKRSAQPLVKDWSEQVRKLGYNPEKLLNDLNRTLLKYRSKM